MSNIRLRVAELRKKKEMTQEDLAKLLGISSQSVSKWETGNAYPDIMLLPKLSEVLGSSVDYILGIDSDSGGDLMGLIKKGFHEKSEDKRFDVGYELSSILFEGIASNGYRDDVGKIFEPASFIGGFGSHNCLFDGKEGFVAYLLGMSVFGSFEYMRKVTSDKSLILSEIFSSMGDERRVKLLIKWCGKAFDESNPELKKPDVCELAECGIDEILSVIKPLIKSGIIIREVTDEEEIVYKFADGMICLIYPILILTNAICDLK